MYAVKPEPLGRKYKALLWVTTSTWLMFNDECEVEPTDKGLAAFAFEVFYSMFDESTRPTRTEVDQAQTQLLNFLNERASNE